ncbi:hypothetical protein JTB14_024867 [Gonioctena quinquepunctata]|nr:hypothetical protein JTB14_024867 [Gonioctena quinquepunctata]
MKRRDYDESQGEIPEENLERRNVGEERGTLKRTRINCGKRTETEAGGGNNQAGSTDLVAEQTATVRKSKAQVKQFCNKNSLTYREDIRWRRGITYISPPLPKHIPGQSNMVEELSPYKYFSEYFTQNLWNTMAEMTNLFVVQNNVHNFPATDASEIKTLLGIHIIRAIYIIGI